MQAVYAQHSGAESCGFRWAARGGERPVVQLARGSHAAYFRTGLRDRTWPDPNDEADGAGPRMRPPVVRIDESRPPWMRYPGRWGDTVAGWVPGEMSSPRGPAFQPQGRWSNPEGWAAAARPCTREDCDRRGECDGRETAIAGGLACCGPVRGRDGRVAADAARAGGAGERRALRGWERVAAASASTQGAAARDRLDRR